ncbi:hypothetical protein [Kitasatospora sp. NPDC094011]
MASTVKDDTGSGPRTGATHALVVTGLPAAAWARWRRRSPYFLDPTA